MNSLGKCIVRNLLFSRIFQENRNCLYVRYLYNDQFLGVDKYVDARQRTITRLGNMRENFYNRMKSQVNSPVPSMIFTEDLKTVIHTCEDNPEDLDLCVQMMKRYHKQNKELRFGTFIFGPVTMRLFYYLKKQDMIDEFFKDPELESFFDQLKSYYLGMDLYFKNGKYQEILDSFDQLHAKKIAETKFPREGVVLATGACYKLNTPETLQRATELVTLAREARVPVLRKALSFVVALALNQNKPDFALEILSSIDHYNNITGNNLKLLAYAGLNRIQDAFGILRQITNQDAPVQSRIRSEVCQSTVFKTMKVFDPYTLSVRCFCCQITDPIPPLFYKSIYPEDKDKLDRVPLILIHGELMDSTFYERIAPLLAKSLNREIILVDLRNSGKSSHSEEFSYSLLEEDVVQLLKYLGRPEVYLAGFAIGGMVATKIALKKPQLVKGVICINMNVLGNKRSFRNIIYSLETIGSLGKLVLLTGNEEKLETFNIKCQAWTKLFISLSEESAEFHPNISSKIVFAYVEDLIGSINFSDEENKNLFPNSEVKYYKLSSSLDNVIKNIIMEHILKFESMYLRSGDLLDGREPRSKK